MFEFFHKKKKALSQNLSAYLSPRGELGSNLYYRDPHKRVHRLDRALFQDLFRVEFINQLHFADEKIIQSACELTAKRLKKDENQRISRWMSSLYREEYANQVRFPLSIEWIDPFLGYGVFALEEIPALCYIGEYTGFVRTRKRAFDRANDYIFRYMVGPKESPYVIDAKKTGNHTRFFNHSDEPNLRSSWIVADGFSHIIFFSKCRIKKGEQLTYDYGPCYWKKRPSPLEIEKSSE